MSNYIKATNFATKDALTTGNPLKTLSGTELDDEYTNIATAVATKANTSSPTLTGTPAAPTAATANNSTQIATTAFAQAAIVAGVAAVTASAASNTTLKATLASPALTGTPTAPTASSGTNTTQVATTAFTTAAVGAITAATINALVYPVGSIYTSVVSTNPNTTLGMGTWTAFGSGRTLVGISSSDTEFNVVEETGGAKTHTLSTSEMPAHTHASGWTLGGGDGSAAVYATTNGGGGAPASGSTGSGAAHNNLQPYIVVYFWKRTA